MTTPQTAEPITAIIAEDEPILRAQLKLKLGKLWPELNILADVGDGEAALEADRARRGGLSSNGKADQQSNGEYFHNCIYNF